MKIEDKLQEDKSFVIACIDNGRRRSSVEISSRVSQLLVKYTYGERHGFSRSKKEGSYLIQESLLT